MIESPTTQGLIACPYCTTPVPMTVQNLLAGLASQCPGCDASFEINAEGSQQALDKLSQWHQSMEAVTDEANSKLAETSPESDEPPAFIKRKRRPRRGESQ